MTDFTKILKLGEYRNIFELATNFKGSLHSKLAALKIAEKISKASSEALTEAENGEKVLPNEISVTLTKIELDGYWQGILGYVSDEASKVEHVLIAKSIATVLGMSKRFAKLEETLNIPEDPTPLD